MYNMLVTFFGLWKIDINIIIMTSHEGADVTGCLMDTIVPQGTQ